MEPFTRLAHRVGRDGELSFAARCVYAALDAFLDKKTGHCAPSVERLALWLDCDRSTVRRSLVDLEAAGYVVVNRATGYPNSYTLVPALTQVAGEPSPQVAGEPSPQVAGEPSPQVAGEPGQCDSDRIRDLRTRQRTRGKNGATPSPGSGDLFQADYRKWFIFDLGEVLDRRGLGDMREWFAPMAADFFLGLSWHRPTDPEQAGLWAKQFAGRKATEAELVEAFAWALESPGEDARGRPLFSRPDYLRRILFRVDSVRKRRPTPRPAEVEAAPAAVVEPLPRLSTAPPPPASPANGVDEAARARAANETNARVVAAMYRDGRMRHPAPAPMKSAEPSPERKAP